MTATRNPVHVLWAGFLAYAGSGFQSIRRSGSTQYENCTTVSGQADGKAVAVAATLCWQPGPHPRLFVLAMGTQAREKSVISRRSTVEFSHVRRACW